MNEKVIKNLKILQDKVLRKTGKEFTQEELLDKVIKFITQNEGYFFQTQFGEMRAPTHEEYSMITSIISELDVKDTS